MRQIVRISQMVLVALLLLGCPISWAYSDKEIYLQKIVSAIEKAENSHKYPFGIKSVKVNSYAEARQTCLDVVRWRYFQWSTRTEKAPSAKSRGIPFLVFLRDTYCPLNATDDPTGLNVNWLPNVSRFMEAN